MKNLFLILCIVLSSHSQAQFDTDHVNKLSKLNCSLTDSWGIEVDVHERGFPGLDMPILNLDLISYLTEDDEGSNYGIGIYIFERQYEQQVVQHDWKDDNSAFEIIKTKSYIMVMDYFVEWHETYETMLERVLPEIRQFLNQNQESL